MSPPLRSMPASAPNDGTRSARWMRYGARARSTVRMATRRSRLFSSASATADSSRGSTKNSRQPMSAALPSPMVLAGNGHSAGMAGAAAGTAGCRGAQPAMNRVLARASVAIAGLRIGVDSCLAVAIEQALHDHEEQRDEEHAQCGADDHAAEHAGTDRALRTGAGAGSDRQRQHAETERKRGHDDRAQAIADRLHGRGDQFPPLFQVGLGDLPDPADRTSTRLNSSH